MVPVSARSLRYRGRRDRKKVTCYPPQLSYQGQGGLTGNNENQARRTRIKLWASDSK